MDVKGITWVGNIYQKFETMCLEVEEIMYQDTVKYVENQVQTVGASVKRFYSDVIEDLLPPSSLDPEKKVLTRGFAIEQDSDNGVYKKANVSKKEKPVKIDVQKLTEDDNDMDHAPLFIVHRNVDNLCKPSSGNCVKRACSDMCSRSDSDGRKYSSSNLGVEENLNTDKSNLIEASCPVTYIEKTLSRESSSQCELLNENKKSSYDQTDTTTVQSVGEDTKCDTVEEICNVIENASQCTSSGGLSAESNAAEICSNNEIVSVVGSSQNEEIQYDKCTDEDVCLSHPGGSFHWSFDSTENNNITEHGMETILQTDKAKLEETCVVVNGDELHFVPQREEKRRTYKKKIREAFSSRMRSARKMEYEQLALLYGDDPKLNQECREALTQNLTVDESKKLPNDNCESEWELL